MTTPPRDDPVVTIRPASSRPPWSISCTCARCFESTDTYRRAFAAARAHFVEHCGPGPRATWPGGPVAYGSTLAISPDASDEDIEHIRSLWLEFGEVVDPTRNDDPEMWFVFLSDLVRDRDARAVAYLRVFRATSLAWEIEQARHEPGWELRLYALAERCILADEQHWEMDLVTTGDGLTLGALADLVGSVYFLPEHIRRKFNPSDARRTEWAGPGPAP